MVVSPPFAYKPETMQQHERKFLYTRITKRKVYKVVIVVQAPFFFQVDFYRQMLRK